MYAEEAGITNGEAVDISLIEFARIYAAAIEMDIAKAISIACVVLISLMGLTMLLCLLFSALKKPIPVIVFDCLTFGLFRHTWCFVNELENQDSSCLSDLWQFFSCLTYTHVKLPKSTFTQ